MKNYILYFVLFSLVLSQSSCKTLFSNRLFQQKDYQFFELAQKQVSQYSLQPGDDMKVNVYSRDGFKLIDVLGGVIADPVSNNKISTVQAQSVSETQKNLQVSYLVDKEGFAKLPILGQFYVKGYTTQELERILAEKYAGLFVEPYVVVQVINRRVFVFKSGASGVIDLNDYPTTLIEVLAKSGGIARDFKSYNIKIIRGDLKNPQVQIVDLSTLEGIRKAELTMEPNDIVYVDEKRRATTAVLMEISPILGLATSTATIIFLAQKFGK